MITRGIWTLRANSSGLISFADLPRGRYRLIQSRTSKFIVIRHPGGSLILNTNIIFTNKVNTPTPLPDQGGLFPPGYFETGYFDNGFYTVETSSATARRYYSYGYFDDSFWPNGYYPYSSGGYAETSSEVMGGYFPAHFFPEGYFDSVAMLPDTYQLTLLSEIREAGWNPHHFVKLFHGRLVECLSSAPDATTFRDDYYYNPRLQALFGKKWIIREPKKGMLKAIWKYIST